VNSVTIMKDHLPQSTQWPRFNLPADRLQQSDGVFLSQHKYLTSPNLIST